MSEFWELFSPSSSPHRENKPGSRFFAVSLQKKVSQVSEKKLPRSPWAGSRDLSGHGAPSVTRFPPPPPRPPPPQTDRQTVSVSLSSCQLGLQGLRGQRSKPPRGQMEVATLLLLWVTFCFLALNPDHQDAPPSTWPGLCVQS